jgi:hypothetical protein
VCPEFVLRCVLRCVLSVSYVCPKACPAWSMSCVLCVLTPLWANGRKRDGCDSQVPSFYLGVDPSELLLFVRRGWPWGTRRSVRGTVFLRHARLRWQWRLLWCRPICCAPSPPFKLAQRSIQSSAFSIALFVLERKSRPQKGIKLIRPCLGCVLSVS